MSAFFVEFYGFHVSERDCSHPEVELAIAEMACVSSNVRRTFHVPSGVRVQRSISERDFSHPIRLVQTA